MTKKLRRKRFGKSAEEDSSDEEVTYTSVSTIKPPSDWKCLSDLESSESEEDEIKESEKDEDEPPPPNKETKDAKEGGRIDYSDYCPAPTKYQNHKPTEKKEGGCF